MYSFLHKIFMYVLYMICNTIYGVWTHIQCINYTLVRVSLTAQLVKNPPAMQETWVRSLGWEDPLEKGKPTYSSILAWSIPWTV